MSVEAYYNDFYRELARIDGAGDPFAKIAGLVPPFSAGSTALDVGCGYGGVCRQLAARGYEVAGVEINTEALESLRRAGIRTYSFDLNDEWPLEHRFDLIVMVEVLEHLFDPIAALEQAKRHLEPGGKLIVSVPIYFDLVDRLRILWNGRVISYDNLCYGPELYRRFRSYNYDHLRFFRPAEVLELIRLLGFQLEAIEYSPIRISSAPLLNQALRVISNAWTVRLRPSLLAHGMALRMSVV